MPPKPKNTREEVIKEAIQLIREEGVEGLTARNLAKRLNASAASLFTHFGSMDELMGACKSAIFDKWGEYVEKGLSLNPPFKGFALEYIRFAQEEPKFFALLFMKSQKSLSLDDFIGVSGHETEILQAVCDTFHLNEEEARWLYHYLWTYVYGMAALVAMGVCTFTDEEISERCGIACRGFLMSLKAPKDARTSMVPGTAPVELGDFDTYLGKTQQ